ncbi:MAG: phospholipase D-like domain-containing protein [Victivallaceae bacterium]
MNSNNKSIKLKRLFIIIGISFFFIFFKEPSPPFISEKLEPIICSHQIGDNLKKNLVSTIKTTKKSLFLKAYQITDQTISRAIIEVLKNKNIIVDLECHELKECSYFHTIKDNAQLNIKLNDKPKNKLMHMKILMIDECCFWIGSANFTDISLCKESNLMVGFYSQELAEYVRSNRSCSFMINEQKIDFKVLPNDSRETLEYLIKTIDTAQKSIKIAMFAFSHPKIMAALENAYLRGVDVEIIIDKNYLKLTKQILKTTEASVPVWYKTSKYRLHHKFAWIDEDILIFGSTNWTMNGFNKNDECMLFLDNLTEKQNRKMRQIWNNLTNKREVLAEIIPFPILFRAA